MTQPAITDAGREVSARRSVMEETRSRLEVPVQHEGIEVGPDSNHKKQKAQSQRRRLDAERYRRNAE
jgi:hypothetical protein